MTFVSLDLIVVPHSNLIFPSDSGLGETLKRKTPGVEVKVGVIVIVAVLVLVFVGEVVTVLVSVTVGVWVIVGEKV